MPSCPQASGSQSLGQTETETERVNVTHFHAVSPGPLRRLPQMAALMWSQRHSPDIQCSPLLSRWVINQTETTALCRAVHHAEQNWGGVRGSLKPHCPSLIALRWGRGKAGEGVMHRRRRGGSDQHISVPSWHTKFNLSYICRSHIGHIQCEIIYNIIIHIM